MNKKAIIEAIYYSMSDQIDMCGASADHTLDELRKKLGEKSYGDMEQQLLDTLTEGTRNGFYNGFLCAAALLTQEEPVYMGKPLGSPCRQF